MISKTFEAKVENLNNVLSFVESELENHEASMKVMMPISVAVEELFVNVASYAYEGNVGQCTIEMDFVDDDVIFNMIDSGFEFNPVEKDDPDISLSAEERGIGGLGILMVKKYMDSVTYERIDGKNILTMKKRFKNV